MKKLKLIAFTVFCVMASTVSANTDNFFFLPDNYDSMSFIPSKFCANNSAKLVQMYRDYESQVCTGKIYNTQMQLEKTIPAPFGATVTATIVRQSAAEVKPLGIEEKGQSKTIFYDVIPEDDIQSLFVRIFDLEFVKKGNDYFYPYSKNDKNCQDFYYYPNEYGDKYPTNYYTYSASIGTLYEVEVEYGVTQWEVVKWNEGEEIVKEWTPYILDLQVKTESSGYICDAYFTQHLFNNDDLYEYIMPTYTTIPYSYEDASKKENGERLVTDGFQIINENGKVVNTIKFPGGYYYTNRVIEVDIIDLGDVCYLRLWDVEKLSENDEAYNLMYRIDSNTNSINAVSEPIRSCRVLPTAPKAGTPVKVELGEPAGPFARVALVSESGQTVWSKRIPAGETSISIDTDGLSQGLYVVVVSDGKTSHESTKIIIR